MVNVDYLRPGDLVFGRNQRGADGCWKQPIFEVVSREDDGMIVVQERNVRREPLALQLVDPHDLYSVRTTLNYLREQINRLRVERGIHRNLLVKMGAVAAQQSPDLAERLEESLQTIADNNSYPTY